VRILAMERLGQAVPVRLSPGERRRLEKERLDVLLQLDRLRTRRLERGEPDVPMLPPAEPDGSER
jgi:hypothetical protein